MKKFLSLALVAIILGATVTGCKGKSESNNKANDSIATILGDNYGEMLKSNMKQNPELADLDKEQIIKGIETIFKMDTTKTSKSFMMGLRLGTQLFAEIQQLEEMGVTIDRRLLMNEMKKAINSKDSIDMNNPQQMMAMQQKMQKMQNDIFRLIGKSLDEKGKQHIAEQLKNDKAFKKTKSGIAYKVVKAGSGDNITDGMVANVALVIKRINGKEINSTNGQALPIPITTDQEMPGFNGIIEVLKLMKPGSKVVAIIPGKLAFGEMGDMRSGIGPNETLVYEMTVVDAHKEEPKPAVQEQQGPQSYPGRPNNAQPQAQPQTKQPQVQQPNQPTKKQ